MIQKHDIINREHYNSIIYLSHPYGGKQENLNEIKINVIYCNFNKTIIKYKYHE